MLRHTEYACAPNLNNAGLEHDPLHITSHSPVVPKYISLIIPKYINYAAHEST